MYVAVGECYDHTGFFRLESKPRDRFGVDGAFVSALDGRPMRYEFRLTDFIGELALIRVKLNVDPCNKVGGSIGMGDLLAHVKLRVTDIPRVVPITFKPNMFSSTKDDLLFQHFRARKSAPETLNDGATRISGEGRKLDKSHSCPSCKKTVVAPGLTRDDPLFAALGGEVKDYAPEHAEILCQETYTTVMPQVEYQTKCPACGKEFQVEVQDLEFQCSCTPDTTTLTTIIGYRSFRVSKTESQNLRETRGLRAFLRGPEAAQAQFFLKVTHKDHVHAFCSRCGGPVMVTFHGLSSAQESFEFTCRQCGKHGNYKREPTDFEDKPLIESNRKNP